MAMRSSNKQKMLDKLEKLKALDVKKVNFGTLGPELPEGAFLQPLARFNFVLTGCRQIVLPINGEAVEVALEPGDMYISVPNSWEFPVFTSAHEVLCLIPRGSYFRVSSHEYWLQENGVMSLINNSFHTTHTPSEILHLVCQALCSCAATNESRPVRNLVSALKEMVLAECLESSDEPQGHLRGEVLFQQMQKWLENHFQQAISRDVLAAQFHVSPSYVSRLYRRMTGDTFVAHLTKERLTFARTLLAETDLAIFQVAEQCGFSNSAYFVKCFRETYGTSPAKFRKQA